MCISWMELYTKILQYKKIFLCLHYLYDVTLLPLCFFTIATIPLTLEVQLLQNTPKENRVFGFIQILKNQTKHFSND